MTMPTIPLTIVQASYAGGLSVRLSFSDGTTRTVDIGSYIRRHPHPQYNKYTRPAEFRKFTLEHGNIVWGKNWDMIFPIEQLHQGSLH